MSPALRAVPTDYADRVYAGVLGKIIGVYLGRPFEQWLHKDIEAKLGEITGYVHEKLKVPLIVADDDISGTFTFLRALEDHGYARDITPEQIGQGWLNYLIEERTVLWWGGLGNSTEHTAWLRLKAGIPAPRSGSIALNGRVVAEQIGAQIFTDGWGMVAPGDPGFAADLARRAGSVSHDGEAIHGAQVVAAMEAAAFIEPDLDRLLDIGVGCIPADSLIARLIADIRGWRKTDNDWRKTRDRIEATYGYAKYAGGCHMVPNHALIILALVYGDGDFGRSMMIVNTSGWDTDCNAGNVGCLLGIRGGLAAFDGTYDWRGPVQDQMYLVTADGGRALTDALTEAGRIVLAGQTLAGEPWVAPKNGARFHFSAPGSVQGFNPELDGPAGAVVENVVVGNGRMLRIRAAGGGVATRVGRDVFLPAEAFKPFGYGLMACPALHSGQTARATVVADSGNAGPIRISLYTRAYGAERVLADFVGPETVLAPGKEALLEWKVPSTEGSPVARVGLSLSGGGSALLDRLTWDGAPDAFLGSPAWRGDAWKRAWINAASDLAGWGGPGDFRVIQNHGRGMAIQGSREWTDYTVSAKLVPHLAAAFGVAVRVQGLERYYALMIDRGSNVESDGTVVLRREPKVWLIRRCDGKQTALATGTFAWEPDQEVSLEFTVRGDRLVARVEGGPTLEASDSTFIGGAIALVIDEGRLDIGDIRIRPPV